MRVLELDFVVERPKGTRFGILLLLAAAGCSNAEQPAALAFEVSGHLEEGSLRFLLRSDHGSLNDTGK